MDTGKIADALINEAQQDLRVTDRMTRLAEILDQMSAVLTISKR